MPMNVRRVSWKQYREYLLEYAALDPPRRSAIVFRGQGHSEWGLCSSLDRWRKFTVDKDRDAANRELLQAFRREVILADLHESAGDGRLLELLARHHQLPSPLLDWTSSPYVAAFFALESIEPQSSHVSVFALDRTAVAGPLVGCEFIDDPEMLRFNPRALRQHGVFLRVNSIEQPLEDLLGTALTRYDIASSDARLAMADLDAMRINAANLYGGLDGVCKTVITRLGQ